MLKEGREGPAGFRGRTKAGLGAEGGPSAEPSSGKGGEGRGAGARLEKVSTPSPVRQKGFRPARDVGPDPPGTLARPLPERGAGARGAWPLLPDRVAVAASRPGEGPGERRLVREVAPGALDLRICFFYKGGRGGGGGRGGSPGEAGVGVAGEGEGVLPVDEGLEVPAPSVDSR